jgi:C1A family cysteine protease
MTDYCGFGYTYLLTYSNGTQVITTETNSDAKIMRAILEQGVVIGLLNATNLLSLYSSGIYSYASCPTTVNHAALIVGWDTQPASGSTPAIDYWILKSSWGTSWGESGYFRMVRGVNMCGINSWFYFPIVSSTAPYNNTCSSR